MATAREDLEVPQEPNVIRALEAPTDAGPSRLSINALGQGVENEIEEYGGPNDPRPVPERILVRRIDRALSTRPQDGPFAFAEPDEWRPYSPSTLDTILDELRQGHYQQRTAVGRYIRPLDVHLGARTVFVFYLGDSWNWRFTSKKKAITLGEVPTLEQKNYYDLRHVLNNSSGQADPFDHPDMCKIVYFTARPTDEVIADPTKRFKHPFNVNVEIVFDNDDEGASTMPIVIDPDVRYPGGSGVEGGGP